MAQDRIVGLAKRMVNMKFEDLTAEEIRGAKYGIMDGVGVTLAGSTLSNKGHILVELALDYGGKAESTVLGYGGKIPAPWAAFANGAMVHCLDYDDYYSRAGVHPSHACLSAGLAIAEMRGDVSGKEFLTAFAAAGDLLIRIGLAGSPEGQKDNGVFNAYATSYFGAAAIAGKLLNLDEDQMVSCLGIGFSQLASTMQILNEPDANMREIFTAFSGKAGVLAALLAQKGVQGVKESLDGKAGYLNVELCGVYHPEWIDVKPGDRCMISDICIKPTPACGQTLIFIDITNDLVKEHDIKADQVKKITVKVGKFGYVLCIPEEKRKHPPLPMDAKFSIPYCVAYCIARGKRPDLAAFFQETLTSEDILSVADKIEYDFDEMYGTDVLVEPGMVTIELNDGTVYTKEGFYQYGCTENPIREEDLIAKFRECAGYAKKPVEDMDKLIEKLMDLENVANISEIIEMAS